MLIIIIFVIIASIYISISIFIMNGVSQKSLLVTFTTSKPT